MTLLQKMQMSHPEMLKLLEDTISQVEKKSDAARKDFKEHEKELVRLKIKLDTVKKSAGTIKKYAVFLGR